VYDTLGWAQFNTGDVTGALTSLRKSLDIRPMAAAYRHHAVAALEASRREKDKTRKDELLQSAKVSIGEGWKMATATNDPELKEIEKDKATIDKAWDENQAAKKTP